ncbi:DNRLRE domain-containing protein [Anaerobacillus sp. CMMVII]|uniref:DNRLRE domain-containing protein n=1 Tax=Anaerobacillus sp. CMMVII TaxID=2755588 RepID=UPI0021B81994|nr:DNRLRE domain-containing protein [Anaerobacillus sp. CMMVII]MCT8140275.1 DNRLRE domain-containing protein [Anaerobacillus sp. CMMVII]
MTYIPFTPTDDAKVDIEFPNRNYGVSDPSLEGERDVNFHKYFNIKSNSTKTTGRVGFYKFNIDELGEELEKATFQLTGRLGSNTTSVELAVFGILENNWSEETITWNTAPNLLSDRVEVTGENESAFFLGTFTVNQSVVTEHSVDVSEFVKNAAGNEVSFLVIDLLGQGGNVNLYSKEEANSSYRPVLSIGVK